MEKIFFSTIGQDSHRISPEKKKNLILGGVTFDSDFCLEANSDGDVVLHAITNAVSGATGVNVLGAMADRMCKNGITDSSQYLEAAISFLKDDNIKIEYASISIEAARPKFAPKIIDMRNSIAKMLDLPARFVTITATTGEGLTECGKGNGIFVTAILSFSRTITD